MPFSLILWVSERLLLHKIGFFEKETILDLKDGINPPEIIETLEDKFAKEMKKEEIGQMEKAPEYKGQYLNRNTKNDKVHDVALPLPQARP